MQPGAPPRGTNKTDGRKLQDSMSHPPVRRLAHVSRNYSSICLAKVKFQRQSRGRVAMGESRHHAPILPFARFGRSRDVTLFENMRKTIWGEGREILRNILWAKEYDNT